MSSDPKKIVIDTNVLISAAICPQSIAAQALLATFALGVVCRSQDAFQALQTVLNRSRFDRYFVDQAFTRSGFLVFFEKYAVDWPVTQVCSDCIDPKDNMFLSLALSAGAEIIVSGDKAHLLSMHPYRGIQILSVRDFQRWALQAR